MTALKVDPLNPHYRCSLLAVKLFSGEKSDFVLENTRAMGVPEIGEKRVCCSERREFVGRRGLACYGMAKCGSKSSWRKQELDTVGIGGQDQRRGCGDGLMLLQAYPTPTFSSLLAPSGVTGWKPWWGIVIGLRCECSLVLVWAQQAVTWAGLWAVWVV